MTREGRHITGCRRGGRVEGPVSGEKEHARGGGWGIGEMERRGTGKGSKERGGGDAIKAE